MVNYAAGINTTLINRQTSESLELVKCNHSGGGDKTFGKYGPCLLSVLDQSITASQGTKITHFSLPKNFRRLFSIFLLQKIYPKLFENHFHFLRKMPCFYNPTNSGRKLLRTSLLAPPCDLQTIKSRQAAVQEMFDNDSLFFAIQNVLRKCPSHLEKILSWGVRLEKRSDSISVKEQTISHCVYMLEALEVLPELTPFLEGRVILYLIADIIFYN